MSSSAHIAAALAAIPDRELRDLRAILDDETVSVRGLLSWLEAAITWEINRRGGAYHERVGPRADIRDESDVDYRGRNTILVPSPHASFPSGEGKFEA